MAKVLIVYYSQSGNTQKMAAIIADSIKKNGVDCDLKKVEDTDSKELLDYDGILIGSPTYYGNMAFEVKRLLDLSVQFHGQLDGKIGGAFSSAANIGGGNETTILGIVKAMLIHGMIVQGDFKGDHYGPVSIGKPDARAESNCRRFGERTAALVKRMLNE